MNFDWEYYINKYEDLIPAGINTEQRALDHWNWWGQYEGRRYVRDNEILFIIITTECIKSIAINLQHILSKMNIKSSIKYILSDYDINNTNEKDKYIIMYNSRGDLKLPNVYIWYQVEQTKSMYFNISALQNSTIIWDYSIKNYNNYKQLPLNNVYYMPLPFYYNISTEAIDNDSYQYDIFFYGAHNHRRSNILNLLKAKYNIKIGFSVFGDERDNYIKSSKIIINLHYYDEAVVETARFNEVLKFNKLIISETSSSHTYDYYNVNLYKDLVVFIDNINDDLSNIDQLYAALDNYLNNQYIYDNKIQYIKTNKYKLMDQSEYFIKRNLLGVIEFTNVKIDYELKQDIIYFLHLPETPIRYDLFMNQPNYNNIVNKIEGYPAIKYNPGWKGRAFSYMNLIYNAQRCNLKQITICEDDCCFNYDFDIKYNIILEFLEKLNRWDLFVGVVESLPEDITVSNVYYYKNKTFIEINKMTSTVFNIYNNTCFNEILKWDVHSKDISGTIDEYIKTCNFKIIVPFPFEFSRLNDESPLGDYPIFDYYNCVVEKSTGSINILIENYLKVNNPTIIY